MFQDLEILFKNHHTTGTWFNKTQLSGFQVNNLLWRLISDVPFLTDYHYLNFCSFMVLHCGQMGSEMIPSKKNINFVSFGLYCNMICQHTFVQKGPG